MDTQEKVFRKGFGLAAAFAFVLMAGCASTPENEMVSEARQTVETAQQSPEVAQHAAVKLQEAERSLAQAEQLLEQGGEENTRAAEHQAYLAKQQATTANQRAALGEAREEVAEASQMREQILRQSREDELQTAERRAQTAERRLESARARAQSAEERTAQSQSQSEEQELAELQETVRSLQAQQTERGMVLRMGDVLFDFGDDELKPGGERSVRELARYLERNPDRRLLVEGYTDAVGAEDFNRQLSERRAESVREQLVAAGIEEDRIEVRGHGEGFPIATNETTAGRQLNRRVEVVVGSEDQQSPEPRTESPQEEESLNPSP
ncbi:OmpA family protein [Gilvimarinus sp. F26214L]|uniref:OmpA family protein n=1 Tax=Gilvimarinus sp. DZF01 TaxID=3461371 RepID=UPI0040453BC4